MYQTLWPWPNLHTHERKNIHRAVLAGDSVAIGASPRINQMLLLSDIRATPLADPLRGFPKGSQSMLHVGVTARINPVVIQCGRDGFYLKGCRIRFGAREHVHHLGRDDCRQQPHDHQHDEELEQGEATTRSWG